MLKLRLRRRVIWGRRLRTLSTVCTVLGGSILALKVAISPYGFVVLAMGSSSLFVSSWLERDKTLMRYAGSLFLFVDLLGVFRWVF